MPYEKGSPPDQIKGLPKHAQEIWISAFNSAYADYPKRKKAGKVKAGSREEYANKTAWGAVARAGYVKKGAKWVKEVATMRNEIQEVQRRSGELLEVGKKISKSTASKLRLIARLANELLTIDGAGAGVKKETVEEFSKILFELTSPAGTFDAIREQVGNAVRKDAQFGKEAWIEALYPSKVVVRSPDDSKLYAADYVIENGIVTFSNVVEVVVQYVATSAMAEADAAWRPVFAEAEKEIAEAAPKRQIIIETVENVLELVEEDGKPPRVKGTAVEVDKKGKNRNRYKRRIMEAASNKALERGLIGLGKHPEKGQDGKRKEPSHSDVVTRYDRLWFEGDELKYEAEIVPTQKGQDLLACARARVPIRNSIRGVGSFETVTEGGETFKDIGEDYELLSIDVVLENPAFEKAGATAFIETEEEIDMDKLQELQASVDSLTKIVESQTGDVEAAKKVLAENQAKLDAAAKVQEILESEEVTADPILKDQGEAIKRHLGGSTTIEEVELKWPLAKKLLQEMGNRVVPAGFARIEVHENRNRLEKRFGTIEEAWNWVTDVPDTGDWDKDNPFGRSMNNPKFVLTTLIENYLIDQCGIKNPFVKHPKNPLYHLTEAIGDDDTTIMSDIDVGKVHLFPLIRPVFEDLWAQLQGLVSIQPLSTPTGKLFYKKVIYEDTAGDPRIMDGQSSTYANQGTEAGAPPDLVLQYKSVDISLDTTKKLRARVSVEAMQDLRSQHGLNFESEAIQDLREEILREIAAIVVGDLLTGSSDATDADNCATAGNYNWSTVAEPGWSEQEWLDKRLAFVIAQANALIEAARYRSGNWLLYPPSVAPYIETMNTKFATDGKVPATFGLEKTGTFNGRYACYKSTQATANTILIGYKGTSWLDAAYAFMPYVLFYMTPAIHTEALEISRTVMSRWAKKKIWGKYFATVTIT